MIYGIAKKENLDVSSIKVQVIKKINLLSKEDAHYLVSQMAILIDLNLHQEKEITDKNVHKDFINFLIKLFY